MCVKIADSLCCAKYLSVYYFRKLSARVNYDLYNYNLLFESRKFLKDFYLCNI